MMYGGVDDVFPLAEVFERVENVVDGSVWLANVKLRVVEGVVEGQA